MAGLRSLHSHIVVSYVDTLALARKLDDICRVECVCLYICLTKAHPRPGDHAVEDCLEAPQQITYSGLTDLLTRSVSN